MDFIENVLVQTKVHLVSLGLFEFSLHLFEGVARETHSLSDLLLLIFHLFDSFGRQNGARLTPTLEPGLRNALEAFRTRFQLQLVSTLLVDKLLHLGHVFFCLGIGYHMGFHRDGRKAVEISRGHVGKRTPRDFQQSFGITGHERREKGSSNAGLLFVARAHDVGNRHFGFSLAG